MITCAKGYTWNPSTCECQCDMWCKPGQYLDHKNCVCKNKLIGRLIEECTSIINENMINIIEYIKMDIESLKIKPKLIIIGMIYFILMILMRIH